MKRSLLLLFIVVLALAVCLLSSCGFLNPAESISVERFMYYHTVEEIADYWSEYDDPGYVAEVLNEEWDSMYFLTEDEMRRAVDLAFAYGYQAAATGELLEYAPELGEPEVYSAIDEIYDCVSGAITPKDVLE